MKSNFRRLLSLVLAFALAFQLLPWNVLAVEPDADANGFVDINDGEPEASPEILEEVESLRTEGGKHFRMSDGSFLAVSYGMPVHYEGNGGTWEDIDNTLALASETASMYTARNGDSATCFASTLEDGLLFSTEYAGTGVAMMLLDPVGSLDMTLETEEMTLEPFNRTVQAQVNHTETDTYTFDEEETLEEQLLPDGLSSSVLYADVFQNVDLLYEVTGYNIKESIVVHAPLDSYVFSFRFLLDGLTPVMTQEGGVLLVNEQQEPVYEIPAPYLFDSANQVSSAASYSIDELPDGFILTVEAEADWMNAPERVFPVTIDPTLLVVAGNASGDISATYVEQGLPNGVHGHYQDLYLGYTEYNDLKDRQIYMHVNQLPEVPKGSVVVNATLNLWQFDYSYVGQSTMKVGVYPVTTEKPSNYSTYHDWIYYMTWNNRAAYDSGNMIDFATLSDSSDDGYVSWDVTELVNDWYYNGEDNATLLLKTVDSYSDSSYATAALYAYGRTKPPIITVTYRNSTGLEPYYTYQTFSAGEAGMVYISDYSSQITIVNELFSFNSGLHPMSFQMVFNSSYFSERIDLQYDMCKEWGLDMHVGSGITYNFLQRITEETISGINYMKYQDGDGTIHYFQEDPTGETDFFYDEDGLGLKIEEYAQNYYRLMDDKGNTLTFVNGFLLWIEDESGNRYKLVYSKNGVISSTGYPSASGSRLERIDLTRTGNPPDKTLTVAKFYYKTYELNNTNVSNYLDYIKDYSGTKYYFEYQQGKLYQIKRGTTESREDAVPIAEYGIYKHSSGNYQNQVDSITDTATGYTLNFTYTNHQLTKIQESIGPINVEEPVLGKTIDINPLDNRHTEYTDYGNDPNSDVDDITTSYAFDYAGRTINVYSTDSNDRIIGASNAAYTSPSGDTDKRKNHISATASIGVAADKKLEGGGFEDTDPACWNEDSFTPVETEARSGTQSMPLPEESALMLITDSLDASETYALSAYVKVIDIEGDDSEPSGAGVSLQVKNGTDLIAESLKVTGATSEELDNGWTRISVSFTAPESGSYQLYIANNLSNALVYVDDVQLETGKAPSSVNLLDNGDFENGTVSDWTFEGTGVLDEEGGQNGSKAVKLTGYYSTFSKAKKTVAVNLPATQTYVLSGWAKGNAVPDTTKNSDKWRSFGIRAVITYSDGTTEDHFAPFNAAVSDWQFSSVTIVPKKTEDADGNALTVTSIRVECSFESNANVAYFDNIALTREAAQTMKYDANGKLESVTTTNLNKDTNTYDEDGNLIEAATNGYGTFEYDYDDTYTHRLLSVTNGLVTQTMTYDAYGNVASSTLTGNGDETPITSSATYTLNGHLLETVTDAAGNVTTYTYTNNLNKQLGAPSSVENAKETVVSYTYDNRYRPTGSTISKPNGANDPIPLSQVSYVYDAQGFMTQVIRSDTENNKQQSYGLTYDAFGNVETISVGTSDAEHHDLVTYVYSPQNGNLLTQTYANGAVVTYSYDNLGRTETVTYSQNGSAVRTLTYTYTGEGRLYSIRDNNGTENEPDDDRIYLYNYDSLGRLVGSTLVENGSAVLETSHRFDANNRLVYQALDLVDKTYAEGYNYDEYGRLSTMEHTQGEWTSDVTYTYDGLSRLVSVTTPAYVVSYTYYEGTNRVHTMRYQRPANPIDIITYTYYYDSLGNITRITDTAGNDQGYRYDALGQLTHVFNGPDPGTNATPTYTYDNFGNILSANGNTYGYTDSLWKDLLMTFNGVENEYDDSGNPEHYYNGTHWTFTWTEGRNLTTASGAGNTISYQYDSNGIRTSKTVNGVTHEYIYAGGKLIRETIIDGEDTTTLDFIYDANGRPYAMASGGTMYYYILNLQGDVVRLMTEQGATVAEYTYDAWGNVRISDDATDVGIANPLRYRGYYYDAESGFYYLQSRYYDPVVGRFINADTYVSTGQGFLGYNMFAYCLNNPNTFVDYSGDKPATWHFHLLENEVEQDDVTEPVDEVDNNPINSIIDYIDYAKDVLDEYSYIIDPIVGTTKIILGLKKIRNGFALVLAPVPTLADEALGYSLITWGYYSVVSGIEKLTGDNES